MSGASTAVVVMDMLNTYDHEDAETLAANVEQTIGPIVRLIDKARRADVELIFVNDNHGDFSAGREELVRRARAGKRPDLVEPLVPPGNFAFLPKVRHSVFYGTPLEYALNRERIETIVLAGQVTEQCVLYSALDAYVREFSVRVAVDGVAAIHDDLGEAALRMMERNMRAELLPAADCL
ncbi:cysteine hydrolase family protein [Herbidospora yilanensis]|uniref:cysteine hydrolase family protein n=1 Tax=Herbidospora yilanensis TaxID=354426 RepID=UPI0007823936|nr:isochorismatase family cysteine hydrolase [Herbidospora yilanensis]